MAKLISSINPKTPTSSFLLLSSEFTAMASFPYMQLLLGCMFLLYIFETFLEFRQRKALKLKNIPKSLVGLVNQEKFEKSGAYNLEYSTFRLVHGAVKMLMHASVFFFALLPWFWKRAGDFLGDLGLNPENEILHSLLFLTGVAIFLLVINFPFVLYSIFVIEARHGFNKQTVWMFLCDMLKIFALSILLGPPIVSACIVIVQKGGPFFAIYVWGFMVVLFILMLTLVPSLIAPLFFNFTPLREGGLKGKIENLAFSLKFPLKKLFVLDGSTKTGHSNAFMYGFCNSKRIILFDTLIQECYDMAENEHLLSKKEDEVVAVIAHELGHWKLNHTIYMFIASQIYILLLCGGYTFVRNSKGLFHSFGFDSQPIVIGFIIFLYTVIPLGHLVDFGVNLATRACEYQADAFAKKLGYGEELQASLVKFQEDNLSSMNVDPWYSTYHYSHPPLAERLAALDDPDRRR